MSSRMPCSCGVQPTEVAISLMDAPFQPCPLTVIQHTDSLSDGTPFYAYV